ncbi:hypothetical protein MTR_8g038240 [Medicago truncatula]|uniref:Uncharacterized protein n=1 Tax=Medicago truncatula TaxID=3880 RepID=G7LF90_MEDTR|nr:hypothetical protein MTR_8g038240 [Medicago truncatula]
MKSDFTGDRTQNLWFRRPAPYPLGHEVIDITEVQNNYGETMTVEKIKIVAIIALETAQESHIMSNDRIVNMPSRNLMNYTN